jgi:hypothetical protein
MSGEDGAKPLTKAERKALKKLRRAEKVASKGGAVDPRSGVPEHAASWTAAKPATSKESVAGHAGAGESKPPRPAGKKGGSRARAGSSAGVCFGEPS